MCGLIRVISPLYSACCPSFKDLTEQSRKQKGTRDMCRETRLVLLLSTMFMLQNCERYVIRELSEISYKNNKLQCIEGGWSTWTTYKGTLARWTDEQIEVLCVMLPFGISSGYILLFPRTPNKWILLLIAFRLKVNVFISKYQYNP